MTITIKDRLLWINDPNELEGFRNQLKRDGNLTAAAENQIALRRQYLTTGDKK